MEYYKELVLKNGRNCILRNPEEQDAEEILSLMKLTSGETDFMLRYPEEITMSVKEEENYLTNIACSPGAIMIAAVMDGRIVANGGITPIMDVYKCSHRAEFGISIEKAYWGMGIGSAIIEGILASAKQAGYEQVELDVVTENTRAIHLYEKFGFRKYGTRPHSFKCKMDSIRIWI